jgi:hypothetical protein
MALRACAAEPPPAQDKHEKSLTEVVAELRAIPSDFNENSYTDLMKERHGPDWPAQDKLPEAVTERAAKLLRTLEPHGMFPWGEPALGYFKTECREVLTILLERE